MSSDTLHVLDSSVWIDLADRDSKILYNLCDLCSLSVIQIGVPVTVRAEVVRATPEWLPDQKKSWLSRIGELEKFTKLLERNEDPFSAEKKPSREFGKVLQSMRESVKAYEGDPNRDMIAALLDSKAVVKISAPQAIHKRVVEQALLNKRPFSSKKNSVADAIILFSVVHWAKRNPSKSVCFYTLNHKDFSRPDDRNKPHVDIEEEFAPHTNLSYCANLSVLAKAVRGLDPADFYPRSEHGCFVCDEPVLIESIGCINCGDWPAGAPDHEGYKLTRFRDGYLVDVNGDRLVCDHCGRKTFDVELSRLCSYHEHTYSKD